MLHISLRGLAATSPAQPAPVSATVKADPAVPLAVDVEELGGMQGIQARSRCLWITG